MTRRRETMTDAVIAKILHTVELGMPPERAAAVHGISASTMRSYRSSNDEFHQSMEQAEAKAQMSLWSSMLAAMDDGPWQMKAWMLERRWPEDYSRREVVRHEVSDDMAARLLSDVAEIRKLDRGLESAVDARMNGDSSGNGTS